MIFEDQTLEFFIGSGFLYGLPCGVDAALTFFKEGETSLITIMTGQLLHPIFKEEEYPEGEEDAVVYIVSLESFKNVRNIAFCM